MISWLPYLIELHRGKDMAYGDAWCRRGETAGIFPNIARKYDRWIRIRSEDATAPTAVEPLDDTLADLLIYAVKYLVWLLERHPEAAAALPGGIAEDQTVADMLTAVTETPQVAETAELIVAAFQTLERIFVAPLVVDDTAGDRVGAAWSLALGAWGELQHLPLPDRTGGVQAPIQPLLPRLLETTKDLQDQLLALFAEGPGRILLLGLSPTALELRAQLGGLGLAHNLVGIAHPGRAADEGLGVLDWSTLNHWPVDYLVVTMDDEKEDLLRSYVTACGTTASPPKVIITGVAHLSFRDSLYAELDAPAMVPSYATGYPYTRVHMFQHLQAAAENGLSGAIVEFGAFKGGTTAWLARVAKHFNLDVPILAFDSWAGFPPRRSVLDMYTHPRCVFKDIQSVRAYIEPLGVELVPGDISDTAATRLRDLPILLAFIDTDNYSPAAAALAVLVDNVVQGGAIVFDHYTTTEEHLYTLGERMAGQNALLSRGFLHVHGTGVFIRLPTMEAAGRVGRS